MLLRIVGLPEVALAAAADFHARVLPQINPPRNGEGDHPEDGGGAQAVYPSSETSRDAEGAPPPSLRDGPPHPVREDLLLVFPPTDQSHRAWRLAAVQGLARELAPLRVNALESADEAAISAIEAYLATAPGVTGQYLPLDAAGATGA